MLSLDIECKSTGHTKGKVSIQIITMIIKNTEIPGVLIRLVVT